MKTYRVTIRLNVETDILSAREVERIVRELLAGDDDPDVQVASVTAYEDVLFRDVA
jgi:hypothetical protein